MVKKKKIDRLPAVDFSSVFPVAWYQNLAWNPVHYLCDIIRRYPDLSWRRGDYVVDHTCNKTSDGTCYNNPCDRRSMMVMVKYRSWTPCETRCGNQNKSECQYLLHIFLLFIVRRFWNENLTCHFMQRFSNFLYTSR